MDYGRIKTRLKDRLTKEYTKTSHTQEYKDAEALYKSLRDKLKDVETEMAYMSKAYEPSNLYANITSGIYTGIGMVKDKIKKQDAARPEPEGKEEADLFVSMSQTVEAVAASCDEETRGEFMSLSRAMKEVSKAKNKMKRELAEKAQLLKEMKAESKRIDSERCDVLDLQQRVEAERDPPAVERMRREFENESERLLERMQNYTRAKQLKELTAGIAKAMQDFFGASFDAFTEEK